VFEDAVPAELAVELRNKEIAFDTFSFNLPNGEILVALWVSGAGSDDFLDIISDIVLPGILYERATGIDTLNGFEQELRVSIEGNDTVLTGMLIKDYPVVLRLDKVRTEGENHEIRNMCSRR
jgi:hypothetical protein